MRKGLFALLGLGLIGTGPIQAQSSIPFAVAPPEANQTPASSSLAPLPVVLTDGPVSKLPASVPSMSFFEAPAGERDCTRVWARADYLLWWVRNSPMPVPLATTGNPNDLAPGSIGAGGPGTRVIMGNSDVSYGAFSGMRLALGSWLDSAHVFGIEGSAFALEQRVNRAFVGSDNGGNPPLYIPINVANPAFPGPNSVTIADPLLGFMGNISMRSSLQLWGSEINGIINVARRPGVEFNLLVGFRYADLRENLQLSNFNEDLGVGTFTIRSDSFNTRNQFYGGQVGGKLNWQWHSFILDATGKVALGQTHEVVDIQGQGTQGGPFAVTPGTFPGGIFAQPSNIGRHTQNHFSVLPSAELKLGYQLAPWMRVFAGYDIMYWNNVVRPGNQIDTRVNTSQNTIFNGGPPVLVGPAQPAPLFNRSDFLANGVNFGMEFRY